jgi:type IX secretion system PorP/SprF family membrane protein
MIKKIVVFTVATLTLANPFKTEAQQDYQVTHFMFDRLSINPAYAGINDQLCASGIFRNQWTGFDGAPRTGVINVHSPVEILRGGLGLTVFNDQLGAQNRSIARLAYSYHLNVLGGRLGVGVSAGMFSQSINNNWITPDGTEASLDSSIPTSGASEMKPDFNFGLYYTSNNFYVGLSTTHVSEGQFSDLKMDIKRHYWFVAGYEYKGLMNGDLDLKPNILIKSELVSTQVDFNLMAEYRKLIWIGATYRFTPMPGENGEFSNAIAPMIGYAHDFKNESESVLKIGYSYGITTSALNQFSRGTHEIALNYCMKIVKPQVVAKSKNPRFL